MGTQVEPSEPVQGDNSPSEGNTPGPNPAWNEVLELLPEQFHPVVTPKFQAWDQAAQSRIESVNSQLKNFEPYQRFVEHGISDTELEQGLRLMYEINNNPENVWKALQEAYKFGGDGNNAAIPNPNGEGNGEEDDDPPIGVDPETINQQGELLQAVAQIVLNDAQSKQAAKADEELDAELNALKEKIGDYDERYVLSLMQTGMSAEDAGNAFVALKQSFAQSQPFAPSVLGSSGGGAGLPSNAVDPTKLSGKETRNLVAQMLEQAAKQQ
jgi:hypothetical protein